MEPVGVASPWSPSSGTHSSCRRNDSSGVPWKMAKFVAAVLKDEVAAAEPEAQDDEAEGKTLE